MNNLEKIIEQADQLPIDIPNQCPNCGAQLPGDYATQCEICGYNLSEIDFECPYKIDQVVKMTSPLDKKITLSFCKLTKKQCKVSGFDFEICSTFRSLDSLKQED